MSNQKSKGEQLPDQHGREVVVAKIISVSNGGHQGTLRENVSNNLTQYNFETTGGLKVEIGDVVEAKLPVNDNTNENANAIHGGPKALVVRGAEDAPNRG